MADHDQETVVQDERRLTGDCVRFVRFDAPQQIRCGPYYAAPGDSHEPSQ